MAGLWIIPDLLMAEESKNRRFKLLYDFDIKAYDTVFSAKLWNPLPLNTPYKKVKLFKFDGNCDTKILYTSWDKSNKNKRLHIEMEIETF